MTTLPLNESRTKIVEACAREWYVAAGGHEIDWDSWIDAQGRRETTRAFTRLLADLTRPASRDFWARELAAALGLTVGATAPRWALDDDDGRRARRWILEAEGDGWVMFADPATGHVEPGWREVPGIRETTDPAAALRLALLIVGGAA